MNISVIGAGNGGLALAGFLTLRGFKVTLYNRSIKRISSFMKSKIIRLEGEINATVKIFNVTNDIKEALEDAKLVMIVVPAFAHADIAEKIYPYVEDDQIFILNPGRTFGALEFYRKLREKSEKIIIAETQTFLFASRTSNPGVSHIFRIKNAVPVSALPSKHNPILREILEDVIPEFQVIDSILYTSFNNIGAVFHPATLILNAGRVESTFGKFEFYLEGITPSVARVLEKIDYERCAIARTLGIQPLTAKDWLNYAYDVLGGNLYEVIHNNSGYQGIIAPPSLQNRYILEDVPMSLVPMSEIARKFGIKTPAIDSIIYLSSIMMGRDFYREGRTLKRLGIENLDLQEFIRFIHEGGVI
ncbi:NADP transhydrogenase subunit alpha [Thermosipho melanesiensis]|uniref:NAD/NADP octopine/nopaline dehydrogenase n=2 Tax=Thermosipho melanesiensis TaxID=46541 RepID=A6LJ59_THEM4|nr:NAD/NADP-dependent octopine/nopaline dehydrogenase family protein [Thermosipho melanesiensis]ABR29960.1 NAD/NADP octopine/nopaline dehydrogenase [Thermosipho melanesiensis BI429]APT73164.1 NADP transhydrogenase subunit alpha [Thermosipho melanesiensis]OOC38561.1 NADP transhydrogenase subunit alpha [Thermosipho melanesiensis]OOC40365.1 NADP transhydrogenase subunit alpha [Thermosipho melanesiensis]OOC40629.1 NADP transhydrogenase subunit alpha [Thermosipho melanesiensis]